MARKKRSSRRKNAATKSDDFQKAIDRSRQALEKILTIDSREAAIGQVISIRQSDSGWVVELQVIIRNRYLEEIGVAVPIYEKENYTVVLDKNYQLMVCQKSGQEEISLNQETQ
jgi:hypothetical protein